MNGHREYDIAFVGLKPDTHIFQYEITDKFFTEYDQQDFTNCHATVKLSLDKNTVSLMILRFDVGGSLEVSCDRCGNTMPLQLWDEFKLIIKLVDNADEMNENEEDPDIHYINRHESHLNVADWIYEFINLSIPMTKICVTKENGGTGCNEEVLKKLEKMKPEEQSTKTIWKGLDSIKGLN